MPNYRRFPAPKKDEVLIGQRMRRTRKDYGITRSTLAPRLGLSGDQLNRIEHGRVSIRFWPAWRYCELMRVNPLWLALGEDHPKIGFAPADMSGIPGDEPFLPVMTAIEKNYTLHRRQFFEISKSAELAFSQSRGIPVPSDSNVEPLSEKLLTLTFSSDTGKSVPPLDDRMLWNELRARLRSATNHYGGKTKLAQLFGVTPQAVTQWLSRNSKVTPTAETTLRLLEWVQREEAKPKKRTGSAETRPALKTRNQKALSHDKPKSGP